MIHKNKYYKNPFGNIFFILIWCFLASCFIFIGIAIWLNITSNTFFAIFIMLYFFYIGPYILNKIKYKYDNWELENKHLKFLNEQDYLNQQRELKLKRITDENT